VPFLLGSTFCCAVVVDFERDNCFVLLLMGVGCCNKDLGECDVVLGLFLGLFSDLRGVTFGIFVASVAFGLMDVGFCIDLDFAVVASFGILLGAGFLIVLATDFFFFCIFRSRSYRTCI